MEEAVVLKTYLASVEIIGAQQERFFRREQLTTMLYGQIESVLSKTGLERYVDYLFIRYENHALIRMHDRRDAAEVADLATMVMLRCRHTELEGRVRIAIHHEHMVKYPDMNISVELPFSGAQWAFAVRSRAQSGEILLSKLLWNELSGVQRIAQRLRPAMTHLAQTGLEEELYALDWVAEQEAVLFSTPLPKTVI